MDGLQKAVVFSNLFECLRVDLIDIIKLHRLSNNLHIYQMVIQISEVSTVFVQPSFTNTDQTSTERSDHAEKDSVHTPRSTNMTNMSPDKLEL